MTGTAALWGRLGHPYDPVEVVDALLGLSKSAARQLVGRVVATSDEAERLLDRMPHIVRSLAVSTVSRAERHHGEIRGPILWGETIAARAASAGDTGLFVCASTTKAYDTDENRVLAAALDTVRRAAQAVEALGAHAYDDAVLRRARANGSRAVHFLEHRTLASVPRTRPGGRALRRARAGTKRQTYRPAVEMLDRGAEPLALADLEPYVDQRTAAQHDLVVAVAGGLETRGHVVPPFRVEEGMLRAGPIRYVHPRRLGAHAGLHGVLVGDLLLDVPAQLRERNPFRAQTELQARAGGRPTFVVVGPGDEARAVDIALRHLARGPIP